MINIKNALMQGQASLEQSSASARTDAEILLTVVLDKTRTYLYTHPEHNLTESQSQHYAELLNQRQSGQPIAYITRSKEFWSLPLMVTPDTLIPRPETELLVELTLTSLGSLQHARILDLGTGSGAIALALASERPTWDIHAYDQSEPALSVARINAKNLQLTQIHFGQSNWFESIPFQSFHAIISNPPYIADNDPHLNQHDLRFEPQTALTSGANGLNAITVIIAQGVNYLRPGGFLLIEHGFDQKNCVTTLFEQAGYTNIRTWPDWQGHDRVTGGFR